MGKGPIIPLAGSQRPPHGNTTMSTSTFDTLSAARELEAAGFTREQAEAAAKTMRDAASASRSDLATRADLYQVALGIVIANAAITFSLIKLL